MPLNNPGVNVREDGTNLGRFDTLDFQTNVTATAAANVAEIDATGGGGGSMEVQNENSTLTASATIVDFQGAGVHATVSGTDVTVTIPGAVPGLLASRPAAAAANQGMLWYATDVDLAYISDGSTWTTLTFDAATALTGTPSGELGGTWASITVDAVHSGSSHQSVDDNAFFYALALG